MNEVLESYVQVIPKLKDIVMEDIAVCITDTTKFLYYRPGDTIDLKNYEGKELLPEDPLCMVMKNGKASSTIVPKDLFGVPFRGISTPIKDSKGNVIGAVGVARSLEKQSKIEEAAENIFASLQDTNASTEIIASNSQEISSSMNKIVYSSKSAEQKIKDSDKILKLIKDMALQSNILAINAAIEATRAGAAGKGFSVVADEMRKLSQTSSDSANRISNLLLEMKKSIDDILKEITSTSEISKRQTAATEQITEALTLITSSSQKMLEISKIT